MRSFERSLPMALLRAREAVMGRFRPMLKNNGVTEQQWRVIRALIAGGEMDASALADQCWILMPSLSRILKSLEARGLIARRRVDSDLRRTIISVTDKGRALFARIAPQSEVAYAEIAEAVGSENIEALYALLQELEQKTGGSRS